MRYCHWAVDPQGRRAANLDVRPGGIVWARSVRAWILGYAREVTPEHLKRLEEIAELCPEQYYYLLPGHDVTLSVPNPNRVWLGLSGPTPPTESRDVRRFWLMDLEAQYPEKPAAWAVLTLPGRRLTLPETCAAIKIWTRRRRYAERLFVESGSFTRSLYRPDDLDQVLRCREHPFAAERKDRR